MDASAYFVVLALGLAVSLGLLMYQAPISQFLRQRGIRVGVRFDGTTVLLAIVLVFDVVALVLLVSAAVLPR